MKSIFTTLAVNFLAFGATAGTILDTLPKNLCSSADLATEPLAQRSVYVEAAWKGILSNPTDRKSFDPEVVDRLYRAANLTTAETTSSHIVNILKRQFEKIREEEQTLVTSGRVKPIVEGQTYTEREYKARSDSTAAAREQVIAPMLDDLYRRYLERMRRMDAQRVTGLTMASADEFYALATRQREILQGAFSRVLPGVVSKLGEIVPVVKSEAVDLPFSYRNGYVVRLRLKKPGAGPDRQITIYPRMLMNQLDGTDEYFVRSLGSWKEYCKERWDATRNPLKLDRKALTLSGPEKELRKKAYEKAARDYEQSQWVHDEMAKLTREETLSLLDMFRQLLFADLPRCGEVIKALNDQLGKLITSSGGTIKEKSRSSRGVAKKDKAPIDRLTREVEFYQDIYGVFSDAAAMLIAEAHSTKN